MLYQLHWLPVEYRVRFKVLVLTFKALCGLGPSYLRDRLAWYVPCRTLRSSNNNLLEVPSNKVARLASIRARAFSILAPTWWKSITRDQGPTGFGILPQGLQDRAVPPGLWVGFCLILMLHSFIGGLLENETAVLILNLYFNLYF